MKTRFAALALVGFAAAANAATLPEGEADPVLAAVARDPRIQAAKHRLEGAHHALQQAGAGAFPQISFDASQGYRENRDHERRTDPVQNGAERQIALRATYDLDLHGRRSALVREAQAQVREAWHRLRTAAHDVIAETAQAQIEAHHSAKLAESQKKLLLLLQQTLNETRELVRLGQADKSAPQRVRQEILAARAELERFRAERIDARARLARLSGFNSAAALLPPLLAYGTENAVRELEQNPGNAPAVAAAQALLDQAGARLDGARAELSPRWTVEAATSKQNFNRERESDASIRAAVTYTIFDGGRRRERTSEALREMRAARAMLKQATLDAMRQTEDARRRLLLLHRLDGGLRDSLQLAGENLRDARELAELQKLPASALLRARAELAHAQIRLGTNRLQIDLASLQLLRTAGAGARAAGLYPGDLTPLKTDPAAYDQ